jgi:Predicted protease
MTNGGKILIIAIATLILALTAPINAQQLPPGPSSTPQYFTCTEIIPTISGSNLTHVIVWLRLSNVTTSNGLLSLLNQMYYNPFSPYFHKFITPQQFASWYSPPNYVFTYIENLATQYGLIVNYTFPMLIEATGNASSVDNLLTALQSAPANITQWILSGECIPIGYFYVNSKAPVFKPQYEMLYLNTTNVNAVLSTNVTVINGVPLQVRYHGAEIWLPKGLEFIYDELPLFNGHTYTGYTGKGVTIAIVDAFGDFAGAYEATFQFKLCAI